MATQIEKLLGAEGQDLLKGEKPTKKDIILLDEYLKKVHPNQRKQTDRVREIISRLKNNFSVWNQNQYQLLSDNNIARKLSHLILSAGNVSNPRTAEVKVNKLSTLQEICLCSIKQQKYRLKLLNVSRGNCSVLSAPAQSLFL